MRILASKPPDFFNNQSFSDVSITYGRGQSLFAHKIILATPASPSYFHRILEESPSVWQLKSKPKSLAQALTREQIDCIALGSQDEPNLIETMIHELYDLQYDPDPEDWITFSADMYLVAKKYGLDKIAKSHLESFGLTVYDDVTTSEYALRVAKFCGPFAPVCYVGTELSERIFDDILEDPRFLLDENETFCKMLEDGTLFNHKFAGRFTMKTVEMLRDADERAS